MKQYRHTNSYKSVWKAELKETDTRYI